MVYLHFPTYFDKKKHVWMGYTNCWPGLINLLSIHRDKIKIMHADILNLMERSIHHDTYMKTFSKYVQLLTLNILNVANQNDKAGNKTG